MYSRNKTCSSEVARGMVGDIADVSSDLVPLQYFVLASVD